MPVSATSSNPAAPATRSLLRNHIDLAALSLPTWVHPEVVYWYGTWKLIRDCAAGEKSIKEAGTRYLPQPDGMDADEYDAFVCRATFYNFTGRTVSALSGSIFRRVPVIDGLSPAVEARLENVSRSNQSLITFCSYSAEEIFQLGRFGVLVDLPAGETTDPRPYFVDYTAENVLDWDSAEDPDTGRLRLTRVVLREAKRQSGTERKIYARYRELLLVDGVYTQYLYEADDKDAELSDAFRGSAIVPKRRGASLDFIPFRIFGPFLNSFSCEKPPMEDIARLNISHFNSYAQAENSRFFCGSPFYYIESDQPGAESDFKIGAPRVWVCKPGTKPGIVEMNGQGLKFLVDALDQKEAQAAALGGRMMGVRGTAVSESNNQLKLAERNEQSILLKTARSLDEGYTQLLRWWAWMSGMSREDADKIEATFNKDFLFDGAGAREFRAIHAMYKDGVITIEIVYEYLKKHNVIPDWMKLAEFTKTFANLASFPGDPDAIARKKGFPDAKTMLSLEDKEREREHELELQEEELAAAQKTAETAAKAAKEAAAAKPPVESARGAFGK